MARLASEEIEPTMARIIGVLFARCEDAKRTFRVDDAACRMWWAVRAMSKLSIALQDGNSPDCVHFSIAQTNERRRVRNYLLDLTGKDPENEPNWNN